MLGFTRRNKKETAEENETSHIRRYMNMNGRGKRKRDQAAQGDTHSKDTDDTDDTDEKRESRKPKQTESRQTEATERKGIG